MTILVGYGVANIFGALLVQTPLDTVRKSAGFGSKARKININIF